jgi:hypothetical protein
MSATRRRREIEPDGAEAAERAAAEKLMARQERTRKLLAARAAKAADLLKRWQTRLKRAQNKVRKMKARVRYYEKLKRAGGDQ